MKTKEEDYIPFSEQWEKEMMKLPKIQIIKMFRDAHLDNEELDKPQFCSCSNEIKTGWTSAHHCNICGKLEQSETWLK